MDEKKLTGLDLLRSPFPDHQISLLPKPYKKDAPKSHCDVCGGYHGLPAAHLSYVGHAALTDRLLDADPQWNWEPLLMRDGLPTFDATGGLWIKLTVCGVTRLGYGHAETSQYKDIGAREKEVIGDALRNAAMRFGAALDLWHKGDLHLPDEDDKKDDKKPKKKDDSPAPQPSERPVKLAEKKDVIGVLKWYAANFTVNEATILKFLKRESPEQITVDDLVYLKKISGEINADKEKVAKYFPRVTK